MVRVLFAGFLAFFYALKIIAGVKMTDRMYPSQRDTAYIIPVLMGVVVIVLRLNVFAALIMMAVACVSCSVLWWWLLPRNTPLDEL